MDLHAPTKAVLEAIIPRLVKGSVLVFDEINHPAYPGETLALDQVLRLNNTSLRQNKFSPYGCYAVFGE
jgi:predicted O-methyltransferase YrrM